MNQTFGQFIHDRRTELRLGLREFCSANKLDPSNYSKYERRLLQPPADEHTLKRIAKGLRIPTAGDSPEWRRLRDLAAAGRGEIPSDLIRNERLMAMMPALFQHLRDHELPEGEDPMEVFAKALRKEV